MASSRNGVGVTLGNGRIYAIGGFDGSMPLNTAEYYDPKVGKWTEISRMNQCRFGVGCAVLHGHVVRCWRSDGTNLKTVERYDPDSNTWMMVASMSTARFGCVVYFRLIVMNICFLPYGINTGSSSQVMRIY
ncbi:hypothetical protein OS493_008577 [Desmophyllum pertusum]|uniref:Uncharacterized protein n=1 Tax=Desmophyllum pertusum TaxID=174260 RepID=A0A9W9ZR57_9CNID|nr:hypothetical protein OS493_008577 [Desmophyllum pertusum]